MTNQSNDNLKQEPPTDEHDDPSNLETVPATCYLPKSQYIRWTEQAGDRNQSVSTFISNMVEVGLKQIQIEEASPNELIDLRGRLQRLQSENDKLRKEIQSKQQQEYQIGLGKIKELIIDNPGIDRREIINHVNEQPSVFVDRYLDQLESSEFENKGEKWYPPKEVNSE